MSMGPGEPVDMAAVDRMGDETAARSEEGAEKIGDAIRSALPAPESRTASFGQGAIEGRSIPAATGGRAY